MPSTKRYFTVLAFGLVLSLCGTLAASDGHDKEDHDSKTLRTTFYGPFGMQNPCDGADKSFFTLENGKTMTLFHQDKHHAWGHFRYFAKGQDSVGQPVKVFIHGKANLDPINNLSSLTPETAVNYTVPFESFWVDNNGAQSWTFSSYMILSVDKTGIFATNVAWWLGLDNKCTGPADPNAPEQRFNHDNDENDDKD